jgi:hypothetical protein
MAKLEFDQVQADLWGPGATARHLISVASQTQEINLLGLKATDLLAKMGQASPHKPLPQPCNIYCKIINSRTIHTLEGPPEPGHHL